MEKKVTEYTNFCSIYKTEDNNFIIFLNKKNPNREDLDIYIIKIDIKGNVIWEKSYGTKVNDILKSANLTDNSGYLILANSIYNESKNEHEEINGIYLIRINNNGEKLWSKIYRNEFERKETENIIYDSNGYFLIFKREKYTDTTKYGKIYKLDKDGNIITEF